MGGGGTGGWKEDARPWRNHVAVAILHDEIDDELGVVQTVFRLPGEADGFDIDDELLARFEHVVGPRVVDAEAAGPA